MGTGTLGAVEARFAEIIWKNAPLSSRELAELAEAELTWKKSTSYTVLKRLCDRGLFQNEKGTVRVCIPREEFYAAQGEELVNQQFDGSLPAFVAAFGKRKKLTHAEIDELQGLIDQMREVE